MSMLSCIMEFRYMVVVVSRFTYCMLTKLGATFSILERKQKHLMK